MLNNMKPMILEDIKRSSKYNVTESSSIYCTIVHNFILMIVMVSNLRSSIGYLFFNREDFYPIPEIFPIAVPGFRQLIIFTSHAPAISSNPKYQHTIFMRGLMPGADNLKI